MSNEEHAATETIVIDGNRFIDLAGFAREFSLRVLKGQFEWDGTSFAALDDILYGGYGQPEGGFVLRWKNSKKSMAELGHSDELMTLLDQLRVLKVTATARQWKKTEEQVRRWRNRNPPKRFTELVNVINNHGPDGDDPTKPITLILE